MTVFVEEFSLGSNTNLVVGVKDNINVAGFVTAAGSKALSKNTPAKQHANVIKQIIQAGSHIIGKLNMHELAYGMTGINEFTGTPVNHLFPHYITGGSSSGCAVAVAQETVDFSVGTDTGGSIRVPAACCGVFGLKPTFGRVSREGVLPEFSTLDCVGPMALSASKIIEAMQIIDSTFSPVTHELNSIRLGKVIVEADIIILAHVNELIDSTNTKTINKTLPSIKEAFNAAMVLMNAEMWQSFGSLLDGGQLGEDVSTRLAKSKHISRDEIDAAEVVRFKFSDEVDEALKGVDALIFPTIPFFPMKIEQALNGLSDLTVSALTRPFNLSGHPALTVPIKNRLNRPMAFQLVGRKGQDEVICEIANKMSNIEIN